MLGVHCLSSSEQQSKPYRFIFGEFEILRWTYYKREGQKALQVPLDQTLGLPPHLCSYAGSKGRFRREHFSIFKLAHSLEAG